MIKARDEPLAGGLELQGTCCTRFFTISPGDVCALGGHSETSCIACRVGYGGPEGLGVSSWRDWSIEWFTSSRSLLDRGASHCLSCCILHRICRSSLCVVGGRPRPKARSWRGLAVTHWLPRPRADSSPPCPADSRF
jgi:hypothetical protein